MSEERILLKFIVGQRVVKQGEDSRFEGEVVACFVTSARRDAPTIARTGPSAATARSSRTGSATSSTKNPTAEHDFHPCGVRL